MGAAAAALGVLLACLLPRGILPDAHAEAGHAVDALLAAAQNAPRLARSAAAKSGVAAGLAALLGVRRGPLVVLSSVCHASFTSLTTSLLKPSVTRLQAPLMLPGLPPAAPAWLLTSPEAASSASQALQARPLPARM